MKGRFQEKLLTFEEDVQLLEKVIMKDNEKLERNLMCVRVCQTIWSSIHHIPPDFELIMVVNVTSLYVY